MSSRTRQIGRAARVLLAAVLAAVALGVLTLAVPVGTWRTGEAPRAAIDFPLAPAQAQRPRRVWIDSDAACGQGARTDPDDCLAILLLARRSGPEIAGFSTVAGNAAVDVVSRTTGELVGQLARAGLGEASGERRAPEVFHGAERAGAGSGTQAVQALRAALQSAPLTIVALGPLTNVSAALDGRPDLHARVRGIVAVMGRREGHWFHPAEGSPAPSLLGHGPLFRDFNLQQDVDAARALLGMRLPLTLIPYEAARAVSVTATDLERLAASGSAGAWVAQRSRAWLRYWREEIGQPGFYPFDAVAAAYVLEPALLHCAQASARITRAEPPFGWLGARALFIAASPAAGSDGEAQAAVTYCPEVAPAMQPWLRDALSRR